MERSEQIDLLAKALVKFQKEVPLVKKDAENPFFKSKYADLAGIVSAVRDTLTKNGLAVSQVCEGDSSITTVLLHESGQFISGTLAIKPVKDDPQGRGSALTYARRYGLGAILGVATEEDDDGNEASKPEEAKPVKSRADKTREGLLATLNATLKSYTPETNKESKALFVQECKTFMQKRYGKTERSALTNAEVQDFTTFIKGIADGSLTPLDYEPFKEAE